MTEEELADNIADPWWRITHFYKIVDKNQNVVVFNPNEAQYKFLSDLHTRNAILKARQRGFSTAIQLLMLDTAMFSTNFRSTVIAQDKDKAADIFRDKFKFAYDNLPVPIKEIKKLEGNSATSLELPGNSIVNVTTSARSGTCNFLHVSEFGKISAQTPGKAKEIVTGSFPAVPNDGIICVESTAEGHSGEFASLINMARKLKESGKVLGKKDWKFHFYSWWDADEYRLPEGSVTLTPDDIAYFDDLEHIIGRKIDIERRNWYVNTRDIEFTGDREKMWAEMPSTPDEAFKVAMEGAYFVDQFRKARENGAITSVPYDPQYPVNTFWDIGASDETAIWFIQEKRGYYAVINYLEASGEPFIYFVKQMEKLEYVWETHYLPHDANHRRQQGLSLKTPMEMLQEVAPGWVFDLVDKIPDKSLAIQQARAFIPLCVFDEANCKKGLNNLEAYRKEWNARAGMWSSKPHHGPESNGADAFLCAAQAKANGIFSSQFARSVFVETFEPEICEY